MLAVEGNELLQVDGYGRARPLTRCPGAARTHRAFERNACSRQVSRKLVTEEDCRSRCLPWRSGFCGCG